MRSPLAHHLRTVLDPLLDKTWALGISGGIDSMVLWDAISQLYPEKSLHIIHVNHQISPLAQEWEAFVEQEALKRNHHFYRHRVICSPPSEANAREQRFLAFATTLGSLSDPLLILGHHQDDQLETALWRFTRGAPIQGLLGIQTHSHTADGYAVSRPLLHAPKALIQEHAATYSISFVEDPSNHDLSYTRNRLRREWLPHISRSALETTLTSLQYNHQALLEMMQPWLKNSEADLILETFPRHNTSSLWTLISLWVAKQNMPHPSHRALLDFCQHIQKNQPAKTILGSHGLLYDPSRFVIHKVLSLYLAPAPAPCTIALDSTNLKAQGQWGGYAWSLCLTTPDTITIRALKSQEKIVWGKAQRVCDGETLWKEQQIPAWKRAYIPLFLNSKGHCLGYLESSASVTLKPLDQRTI